MKHERPSFAVFTHSNENETRKGPNRKGWLLETLASEGIEEERARLLPLALDRPL
jgi:hypothetical protein